MLMENPSRFPLCPFLSPPTTWWGFSNASRRRQEPTWTRVLLPSLTSCLLLLQNSRSARTRRGKELVLPVDHQLLSRISQFHQPTCCWERGGSVYAWKLHCNVYFEPEIQLPDWMQGSAKIWMQPNEMKFCIFLSVCIYPVTSFFSWLEWRPRNNPIVSQIYNILLQKHFAALDSLHTCCWAVWQFHSWMNSFPQVNTDVSTFQHFGVRLISWISRVPCYVFHICNFWIWQQNSKKTHLEHQKSAI